MSKLSIEQRKERLKRELSRIETEEKKDIQAKKIKALKTTSDEVLKYNIVGIDDHIKLVGLLKLFEYKNDKFRKWILNYGKEEIEERRKQKIKRTTLKNREPE